MFSLEWFFYFYYIPNIINFGIFQSFYFWVSLNYKSKIKKCQNNDYKSFYFFHLVVLLEEVDIFCNKIFLEHILNMIEFIFAILQINQILPQNNFSIFEVLSLFNEKSLFRI